jgi:fructosamine-3-kinase
MAETYEQVRTVWSNTVHPTMPTLHPLSNPSIRRVVERAVSRHLGRPWVATSFTDLNDQASHPCGVLHGNPLSVFAKLGEEADAGEQFTAELRGLDLVRQQAGVLTPAPVAEGILPLEHGYLLLFEALPERLPVTRTADDWRAIGHTLARLHRTHADRLGLEGVDGFFGPLRQDNRPVPSNAWADFYAERRVWPHLRLAVDAGQLPVELAAEIEHLLQRLPTLCGPEPRPGLLHGDAQQHNFVSTDAGAVVIDVAPYFGHPELDLALIDYFDPVSDDVFAAYRDIAPIDAGFGQRRELWRIFGYLAVVTVDGDKPFGRRMLARLADAVRSYA